MASSIPKVATKVKRVFPLFNRVLIKRDDPATQSKGGIVLPENQKTRVLRGTVVAVGPGQRNDNGQKIPMTVKPGDYVILPDYGGARIEMDGEHYFMFRENDILAKLQES
ncbi:10 kDa heat shock protein, mitochondrial-like [Anoplophora glabripennis]|uniref:10 kDa heat shock protein, mitochondrial-like n=1 Tax=Anoplophora glabripennis TaxID=217634 RepID=UPI0008750267|nr:10 kDa heat shock protein, mitochondrial-like [Anoplophora glabripennis]